MLQVKNVHIGYSYSIASAKELVLLPGELIALVGRNGSGKSTLIQTLRGQLPCIEGTVWLEGNALKDWPQSSLAAKIAWVNARFAGIPQLSVLDYVLLGRTPYMGVMGKPAASDIQMALTSLENVNALALKNKDTFSLSDGERQLVSIARALAQDTPYIFLDEPTAFLDFYHRKQIFNLLKQIAIEQKKGILLSTHELEWVIDHQLKLWLVPVNGQITAHEPVENRSVLETLLS
jgi:iron complex transport system ATP-binding protein